MGGFPPPGPERFPALGPRWHPTWWHALIGDLVPLLFLLGLAALIVWAVLRITGRRPPVPAAGGWWAPAARPGDAALEQARLRYARGEMSREEYLQTSSDLQSGLSDVGRGASGPTTS